MAMSDDADVRVPVLEVFSSFQGEGPRVGERQVFVRLAGCDLRCAYCDTPESFRVPSEARVQLASGVQTDESVSNPVAVEDLVRFVARLDEPRSVHARVSITGGEPLLHPHAVRGLADGLRGLGLAAHVETGGHRPAALAQVLEAVDSFSPDLKLESATGTATPWEAHRETYALLARVSKAHAVKAVVVASTPPDEVREAAAFCQTWLPGTPLVLQPLTPIPGGVGVAPDVAHLLRLHAAASGVHPDVRVIPQVHRVLGAR